MKIMIFGGNGFIGGHLAENLEPSHEVEVFDRRASCRPDYLGDIKDREAVFHAITHCDRWVNLAGVLGTQELMANAAGAVETNILGAVNIFDAAIAFGKPGLQIAVGNHWMLNPYSITRTASERLALCYNRERGADIRVVRAMNVFGERQSQRPVRKLVPNLIVNALLDQPVTIYGDGEQIMDLIYVKDAAEILSRALLMDVPNSIVYEAGAGGDVSVNQALEIVLKLTESISPVEYVPMRPGEEPNAVVQISGQGWADLHTYLDYNPSDLTPLEKAMARTVNWYRQHLTEFN